MKSKNIGIDNNLYLLRSDYTYDIIKDNSDITILNAIRTKNAKYLIFPINSSNGTKYFLESISYVPQDIRISITGKLSFLVYGADTIDMTEDIDIDMSAETIAEYYALLGSLYNLEVCSEMLDPMSRETEARPCLTEFDIRILVSGERYRLTPELYKDYIEYDEYSVMNQLEYVTISIQDAVAYIQNIVSGKDGFDSITGKYKSFILFDNGTYAKANMSISYNRWAIKSPKLNTATKTDIDKMNENAIVLLDSETPLYATLPYKEFDMLKSDQTYHLSYVAFSYEVNSSINNISDDELNVTILEELDGTDYDMSYSDDMMYYCINQAIFVMLSMADITTILKKIIPWECVDEPRNICYTWTLKKSHDKYNYTMISESITDTMILRDHIDIIRKLVATIRAVTTTDTEEYFNRALNPT